MMPKLRRRKFFLVLTAVSLLFMFGLLTFGQERFNEELLKNFTFRNLGPFRAG